MIQFIKHILKKYCWRFVFKNSIGKQAKELNRQFLATPAASRTALNIFTRHDEDGIILSLFEKIGATNKLFIDIGSNDGINSNCANLAFHHNWSGTFMDGNKAVLSRGEYIYKQHFGANSKSFSFIPAIVAPQNIDALIARLHYPADTDLLCIDLDGNDYHIWKALTVVSPRMVVVEVQAEKGQTEFIPPYDTAFELYETSTPKGASPLSMEILANEKGYSLMATNNGGYNLFFVRKDCLPAG